MDLTNSKQVVERIKTWFRISVSESLFVDVSHITFSRPREHRLFTHHRKGKQVPGPAFEFRLGQSSGR